MFLRCCCRIGGSKNFFHCDKCGCCYSVLLKSSHPCVERAMHQDCPVCFEYLFDSRNDVIAMPCGHTIHKTCLVEMQEHYKYACPICSKSVCDMSKVWEKFDLEIAATPMPTYYENKMGLLTTNNGFFSKLAYEVSSERPLENGRMPKYKPRKVSAVRDFPPGCGSIAVPMILEPEENGGSGAGMVDAIGVGSSGVKSSNIEVESQSHEAMNGIVDVDMTESLDTLVKQVTANATSVEKLRMEVGSVGTQLPDDCHTQGAVDSPIEVDSTESLDALVGKVTTTMMDDSSNDVEELITETNLMAVYTLRSDFSNEHTEAAWPETSIRPKDKYRRRRVSAVRDFPPHCGSNVPLPTEEGKQMVASGSDFPSRIEKVEVEPEANVSSNGLEGGANICVKTGTETSNDGGRGLLEELKEATTEVVDSSIGDNGRSVGKEIVAYSPNGNDTVRPPYGGNELHREVVHALMAEPYCPWRKAKVALNNSDGRTSGVIMRQQNLSRSQKSKTAALNSNVMEDSSGGPSAKKIASLDSKDADGSPGSLTCMDEEDRGAYNECPLEITPISMARPVLGKC
ncbi:UNVERIFIED_CONTAM: E3 ubiquitin-protein ligase RZFP34 [Sesamum radiatum]|uniref:E3 ubiquitin-protein ligase RZFP34 n=1 Tax=Sesamum radiatum TaxID=300843 RepID=A0AAW2L191_SESRA